jgi:hypothetical protein
VRAATLRAMTLAVSGEKKPSPSISAKEKQALVPRLAAALEDEEIGICLQALGILAWLGPEAKSSVPAIVKFIKIRRNDRLGASSGDIEAFTAGYFAVCVLQDMGPAAKEAVPLLLELLEEGFEPETVQAALDKIRK